MLRLRHRPVRFSSLLLTLLAGLAGCGGADAPPAQTAPVATDAPPAPPPAPPAPVAPAPAAHSIDLEAMDRSVRPGADFFLFANGSWYAKTEIPPDRNTTGTSLRVTQEVEQRTRALLEEAAHAGAPAGSIAQRIGDHYASYLDEVTIESRGVAPLAPLLERVAKIKDARALASYLGASLRADVDPLNNTNLHTDHLLGLFVEQDLNDPSRYAPYLLQGGLGMPDRSYYLDETPRMQAARLAYVRYLATILRLAGVKGPDAKAARAFELEKKLASVHATRTESGDVSKGNNPWTRADFAAKAKGLDWNAFFAAAGLEAPAGFIVWHPRAVSGIAALAKSEPLDVWRDYLTARAIDHVTRFLPKAFVEANFGFYGKELRGSQALPPRARVAADLTTKWLPDSVGKVYVERHFPPETKQAVMAMVNEIVGAFGRRIDSLTWMTPATKVKAKEKLATLKVGIGYPDVWRDESGFNVVRGDALGNFERAELFEYKRNLQKLGKPVDRGEWAMPVNIVNAVNLPVRNALNIPAASLGPPYFDPKATAAANYGAVGLTFGHEISHSFDNEGSKFDAKGRFVDWWTPADRAQFDAAAAALAAQFSTYKPFPDAAVDGKLTLSENIADLAGLSAAFDGWRASLGGAPAPVSGGLSGEQQFFLAFAQKWQTKMREPLLRMILTTDGHAPARYRTLTVRNLDAWYSAFDVAPSDPLFLAPNARVRVW
ncbi:M13 family metallopeptidase [Pendulispora albinea]|uniref:M13 family metallopeptidase n=1 Tax=Pendulispora albinea TaxID=2741071 RepID=A0ABZ2M9J8_9BACT